MPFYRAEDEVAIDYFEADNMQQAISIARESWRSADPKGEYDVTITEYTLEDDGDEYEEVPTGNVAHIKATAV